MFQFTKPSTRQVSSGKAEGRFLEPSQLTLQASGSTVMERTRDTVRPAFDFRLTKDTGVVKSAAGNGGGGGDFSVPSEFSASADSTGGAFSRRVLNGEGLQPASRELSAESIPSDSDYAGYLRMYSQESKSSSSNKKAARSSSATPASMNSSSKTAVDRVVVSESVGAPGVPIIYRSSEEKASNPDRLNLDRRRLTVCPILDSEEQLRLLNYQHNHIRKISNLHTLKKLIFLDLYDNQIEDINGVSNLKSLRVLMLGKNRIKKIENLDSLTKLDVLDLHGNEIQLIENLNHLSELRVLNLAGNQITFVDNLQGMLSLAELNLRRNRIKSLTEVDHLPSLQRLFLSCNELASYSDINCLSKSHSLQEVSLDGNPLASDQFYKQTVLSNLQQLKQLDMKRVTDEEKRVAVVMVRKEEDRRRELQKISIMKEKRKQAIHTAKRQWEMMQTTLMGKSNRLTKVPELYASHVTTYDSLPSNDPQNSASDEDTDDQSPGLPADTDQLQEQTTSKRAVPPINNDIGSRRKPMSTTIRPTNPVTGVRQDALESTLDKIRPSVMPLRGNGLAELDGDTLTCYGPGSVDSLDRNWGIQAAGSVTTIVFRFIEFGDIVAKAFNKIRSKFPSVTTYEFTANNIHSLDQLNALTNLRRIENLTIMEEGNPVTELSIWKPYLLFRLAHFSLKTLNGSEVTASEVMMAEKLFNPLSQMISKSLPAFRLLTLLPDVRRKQLLSESKSKPTEINTMLADDQKAYGLESSSRAVLSHSSMEQRVLSEQESMARKKTAATLVQDISTETIRGHKALEKLNKTWEKSFSERVRNICLQTIESEWSRKENLLEIPQHS